MTATTGDGALKLLLASHEPAIRYAALTELLDRRSSDSDVRRAHAAVPDGPIVGALLKRRPAIHPYAKWQGAHWRLVSLMDLGVPAALVSNADEYERVLEWLLAPGHVKRVAVVEGLARRCASQEGNALAVGVWLGKADDEDVAQLADNLVRWQWPDGGWNCDVRPDARHSSFNESLPPLLGLARYAAATDERSAREAADRAAEFFLRHRVVFSERTGDLAHPTVGKLHYPPYWHYDILAALRVLASTGHADDDRARDALDLLQAKRRPDGTWQAEGRWWRSPSSSGANVEVVDWGGRGASEPLTLGALRVLKAAARWSPPALDTKVARRPDTAGSLTDATPGTACRSQAGARRRGST